MHLPGSIKKFCALSARDQALFTASFFLLGLIRLSLLCLPLKAIIPRLGLWNSEPQPMSAPDIHGQELFCNLVRLIELASRHTPWQSRCLVQSICLAIFLNWYELPYILNIGIVQLGAQSNPRALSAHAWVSTGKQIASWDSDHTEYALVCQFFSRRTPEHTSLQSPTH